MKKRNVFAAVALCASFAVPCSGAPPSEGGSGAGSGAGETLRFVFLADGRSDTHGDPPSAVDMINTVPLNAINNQILALSPRPSFVVMGGDMAYRGHYEDTHTSFYTFQTWKDLMSSVTSAGIGLYTIMGNHELYDTHAAKFVLANQTEFQKVFHENPDNGPTNYKQLVYSFTSPGGDAFFAALDPYYLTADETSYTLTGVVDNTQLNWLSEKVAETTATHKFLFIHVPYYEVFNSTETMAMATDSNGSYTKLWSILDDNAFDLYCCGHTHLYSRRAIDSSILPDPQISPAVGPWKNNVVQQLTGTCGAVVDTGATIVDPIAWNVHNQPDTYYFTVVDINGPTMTVTSYSGFAGAYSVCDTFTVQKGPAAVSDWRLLE